MSLWFPDKLYCLHCCSDPSNCICYALLWCIKKRQLIPPVLFAKQRRYDSCRTIIAAGAAADPILHYLLKIYNSYYINTLLVNNSTLEKEQFKHLNFISANLLKGRMAVPIRMDFRKSSKGEGGHLKLKIHDADFGNFKQGF